MRCRDAKIIIAYFYGIPAMKQELEQERAELEEEYDGLRGTSMDGMPHGSTPGNPTEELAVKLAAKNVYERMEAIAVRCRVLDMDRDLIQGCIDGLNGRYKRVLVMRHRDGCSWAKISTDLHAPSSTARDWNDKAVLRTREALENVPMVDEILERASRARV